MDKYINYYECDPCEERWNEDSGCTNNSKCPACKKEYQPYKSDDLMDEIRKDFVDEILAVLRDEIKTSSISEQEISAMAEAVVRKLESKCESVEGLFNIDQQEDEQVMAVPLAWQ